MEQDLSFLFNDVELYNPIKFELFDINGDKAILNRVNYSRLIQLLGYDQKRIVTHCLWCNMDFPFSVAIKEPRSLVLINTILGILICEGHYFSLSNGTSNISLSDNINANELHENYNTFIEYEFKCTNDTDHIYYMFIAINISKSLATITKIGQYPSMVDVHGFDFDKYKKQLDKINALKDYKKADICFADGFSAGAYTYLRRVFEKMLNSYCEGKQLEDNHTETKIKACEEEFDPRIKKLLTRLYSILSKGIHQLDDEESKNYYEYLKIIIDMQLEYIKEKDDNEEQTKLLDTKLNDIIGRIK